MAKPLTIVEMMPHISIFFIVNSHINNFYTIKKFYTMNIEMFMMPIITVFVIIKIFFNILTFIQIKYINIFIF